MGIAKTILGDPMYYKAWVKELKMMSNRILQMRSELKAEVDRLGTPGTWNHIVDQIGMFTFTGLSKEQVLYFLEKYFTAFCFVLLVCYNYFIFLIDFFMMMLVL